jgi:hypothetical protein
MAMLHQSADVDGLLDTLAAVAGQAAAGDYRKI